MGPNEPLGPNEALGPNGPSTLTKPLGPNEANWDFFYKRNTNKFFKDREKTTNIIFTLLEVGWGVGNSVLPLLDYNPNLIVFGGDFSPTAIKILRQGPRRCHFVGNFLRFGAKFGSLF